MGLQCSYCFISRIKGFEHKNTLRHIFLCNVCASSFHCLPSCLKHAENGDFVNCPARGGLRIAETNFPGQGTFTGKPGPGIGFFECWNMVKTSAMTVFYWMRMTRVSETRSWKHWLSRSKRLQKRPNPNISKDARYPKHRRSS